MKISAGDLTYTWIENWASQPNPESARLGWAHHGIVATQDDELVTFHSSESMVLVFDSDGHLVRSWEAPLIEAHGMALAFDRSTEYLWVADPGAKRDPSRGYEYEPIPRRGQVAKFDLGGRLAMRLERPQLPAYEHGMYSPTSVTVFQDREGGNGDVWVADGYGQSLVHRYTAAGEYRSNIDGEEGNTGRFNCPHGVFVDTRRDDAELCIADRSNRRIQVYDLEGRFKRSFGQEFLTSPSAFACSGDYLFTAELRGRVTVTDLEDRLVGYLGANPAISDVEPGSAEEIPGWPNRTDANGSPTRPRDLNPGKFNSPHGIAADQSGNLYVVEWLIGGRYTKLVAAHP